MGYSLDDGLEVFLDVLQNKFDEHVRAKHRAGRTNLSPSSLQLVAFSSFSQLLTATTTTPNTIQAVPAP